MKAPKSPFHWTSKVLDAYAAQTHVGLNSRREGNSTITAASRFCSLTSYTRDLRQEWKMVAIYPSRTSRLHNSRSSRVGGVSDSGGITQTRTTPESDYQRPTGNETTQQHHQRQNTMGTIPGIYCFANNQKADNSVQ
ncbi:hypothetical protein BV898_19713 [Hypsibius exemplaris]|uniref:Uncharacterized protein n=1 Tax=Hypsibius exemplaris TaxID=2072580 RepID=A0A9X6NSN6_HYPEX|nr:hypothetical protein BV898_19713 [Hypsibius exemplaris]